MPQAPASSYVESVLSNRAVFDALVYTPWEEAVKELERREHNAELEEYSRKLLPQGIPDAMREGKTMVLFRNVATSNYEMHRFVAAADALEELRPVIFEYSADRFNDRNEGKYFLGKLCFQKGVNKNGEYLWESVRVIDFNASNNTPLSSIQTDWGERLIDFHHELFRNSFSGHPDPIDLSVWLQAFGGRAKDYYKPFFSLFLQRGILFENYMLEGKEGPFTRDVILPTLMEIERETGKKPLIVALEPTDIEGDQFWYSHPLKDKRILDAKRASM